MKRKIGVVAAATAALLVFAGCQASTPPADESADGQNITFWVMGGDTPEALRDYLKTEYNKATGWHPHHRGAGMGRRSFQADHVPA